MALENKKLSSYDDLASANIDTTTKLVVLTGATKVNSNLPVVNFIEDTLTSTSAVKPLSAKQGKVLQDTKAPIANPIFSGTVTIEDALILSDSNMSFSGQASINNAVFTGTTNGITKAMVGLGNVDNTSDANKPISTAQAAGLAPKVDPTFTGVTTIEDSLVLSDSTISFLGQSSIESPTITGLQTFADNAAAAALAAGTIYKTSTGVLMIKY